jgi:dephospho-CoA kinase
MEQGGATDRKALQALGEKMVATEPEKLCRRVLAEVRPAGIQPVVIDGLRHKEIWDLLRRIISPARLVLIYIDVPEAVRFERLRVRDGASDVGIQSAEMHSTEIQVAGEIRSRADLIVDNSGEVSGAVSAIVASVRP